MNQLNQSEVPLAQLLQTLTASPWHQQLQIIQSLKATPQLIKLINHRNYSSELASLLASHNPRTKLITALSELLVELFNNYANQLIPFANLLISNECLLRLLGSGNKVISSTSNQIMKSIIGNIDFKDKAKHVKFVINLEHQFLYSKNTYVRQKVSLYFLLISTSHYYSTLESLADFQRKVVKQGLSDASEKVRANMKQILENIHHFEKENQLQSQEKALSRKSTDKLGLKNSAISKVYRENKSLRVLNSSSLNQSSILQHFGQRDKSQRRNENHPEMNEQSFRFYLDQLRGTSAWSMISIAYESLAEMISHGYLLKHGNDQLYCQTIKVLTPFLNEKRSRISESCAIIYKLLLSQVTGGNKEKVIAYCQQNAVWIIEQLVKSQNQQLIHMIVALNPSYFLPKIADISVSVKIYRQRLLLLDSIIVNLHRMLLQPSAKGNKKVSAIIRAMCQHIENAALKQKELSLAALTVISQLKQKYPQQVLTALLCQNDKTLTKILDLAQSIDQSLKQAIIEYINSLKGSARKNSQKQIKIQKKTLSQTIDKQLLLVCEQKTPNLNRLGELVLTHLSELDCKQFISILSLLQFLCTADLIMEYKVLMQQISRLSNGQFISAITELLTAQTQVEQDKVREYHDMLLLQLLVAPLKDGHHQQHSKIAKCLVHVYRTSSQSVKKRSMAIQLLSKVKEEFLEKQVDEDERLLIDEYKLAMKEQEQILG